MFKRLRQRKYNKLLRLGNERKYPLLKELLTIVNKVSFNSADFTVKKRYYVKTSYPNAGTLLTAITEAITLVETISIGDTRLNRIPAEEVRLSTWLKTKDGFQLDYLSFVSDLIDSSNTFLSVIESLNSIDITFYGGMLRPLATDITEVIELILAMELEIPNDERHWRSSKARR